MYPAPNLLTEIFGFSQPSSYSPWKGISLHYLQRSAKSAMVHHFVRLSDLSAVVRLFYDERITDLPEWPPRGICWDETTEISQYGSM